MRITFDVFSLEWEEDCLYDSLAIYDGDNSHGHLLATLCGSNLPGDITAFSNQVYVVFISDSVQGDRGFDLQYSQMDPEQLSRAQGMFYLHILNTTVSRHLLKGQLCEHAAFTQC